jgi:CheY-like chemotaxis protein
VTVDRHQSHVLVVDDERSFAAVVSELLAAEGYRVHTAHDGLSAMRMLATLPRFPDVVVCDVMLPGLSGPRLATELRQRFPRQRLPIVLLSASADPRTDLRDVWFLAKPVDILELLDLLDRVRHLPPAMVNLSA